VIEAKLHEKRFYSLRRLKLGKRGLGGRKASLLSVAATSNSLSTKGLQRNALFNHKSGNHTTDSKSCKQFNLTYSDEKGYSKWPESYPIQTESDPRCSFA
jgi:hypothetical protein